MGDDDDGNDEAPKSSNDAWALDAALGAGSILAKAVAAVRTSVPGRLAEDTTRLLSQPLVDRGAEVRDDAGPAAKRMISQVAPQVTEAVDLNELLAVIDLDALLERVDLNQVLSRVDLNALLSQVDLDSILERLDLNAVLQRVDLDQLMDKVDVARLVDRIDVGAVVDRVDVGAVVDRVDVDALVGRIDVNAIMGRVDVDSLVGNTEIGGLIAKSTSGVASSVLDVVRSHGVGLDEFVDRWVGRVLRRDPESVPDGPRLLIDAISFPADPMPTPAV